MNTLREVFYLTPADVRIAIAMRHSYVTADNRLRLPELTHAFSYSSMGWDAYGIIGLLLRYLNNGKPAVFNDEGQRDTLLAFLLAWLEDDNL